MPTTTRWVLTVVIAGIVVGVTAWIGYHWPDVTQGLERAGLEGWRLRLVQLVLVPGLGVLGAVMIRWLWRADVHGGRS